MTLAKIMVMEAVGVGEVAPVAASKEVAEAEAAALDSNRVLEHASCGTQSGLHPAHKVTVTLNLV